MKGIDNIVGYEYPSDLLDKYSEIVHGHDSWTKNTDGHGNIVITFWQEELDDV